VHVCVGMTPFIGKGMLCIHVSYLHPKLGPATCCMVIGWHVLLALILHQSPVFIIPSPPSNCFFGLGGEWGKGFSLSHPIGTSCILQGLGKSSPKSTRGS